MCYNNVNTSNNFCKDFVLKPLSNCVFHLAYTSSNTMNYVYFNIKWQTQLAYNHIIYLAMTSHCQSRLNSIRIWFNQQKALNSKDNISQLLSNNHEITKCVFWILKSCHNTFLLVIRGVNELIKFFHGHSCDLIF